VARLRPKDGVRNIAERLHPDQAEWPHLEAARQPQESSQEFIIYSTAGPLPAHEVENRLAAMSMTGNSYACSIPTREV
jgi:hypothetical protein